MLHSGDVFGLAQKQLQTHTCGDENASLFDRHFMAWALACPILVSQSRGTRNIRSLGEICRWNETAMPDSEIVNTMLVLPFHD